MSNNMAIDKTNADWRASVNRRPFYWAARSSVLEVVQLLIRFPQCQSWSIPFLPSSTASAGSHGGTESTLEPSVENSRRSGIPGAEKDGN